MERAGGQSLPERIGFWTTIVSMTDRKMPNPPNEDIGSIS